MYNQPVLHYYWLDLYWLSANTYMFGFNPPSPTQATPNERQLGQGIPAAEIDAVLFDQLDRLIIDKQARGCWHYCECDLCRRYWIVHNALMDYFPNLQRTEKLKDSSKAKTTGAATNA